MPLCLEHEAQFQQVLASRNAMIDDLMHEIVGWAEAASGVMPGTLPRPRPRPSIHQTHQHGPVVNVKDNRGGVVAASTTGNVTVEQPPPHAQMATAVSALLTAAAQSTELAADERSDVLRLLRVMLDSREASGRIHAASQLDRILKAGTLLATLWQSLRPFLGLAPSP